MIWKVPNLFSISRTVLFQTASTLLNEQKQSSDIFWILTILKTQQNVNKGNCDVSFFIKIVGLEKISITSWGLQSIS